MPEMPASTSTGSIPHVPTFWVLGTRAPMTMPIGIVASSPSRITQATVSQPDGLGHQVVEEQEARHQDHDQLRHQLTATGRAAGR